jgi:hypothetical protein
MSAIFRVLALACLMFPPGVVMAADADYLAELQSRAQAERLAQAREWQVLLHYEKHRTGGGMRSTVTTPWFFNAAQGAVDAQAELDATLAAFFDSTPLSPRDEPAQCVFAARYHWLKSRLGFDAERLPEQTCPRLAAWLEALNVGSVTMVFPAAYLNSPASMFGHTLLRLDARTQKKQTELLAYAVNFAAETEEENGLVFAVRGLTGGYSGSFGIYPYYEKVKEYARIENRDLWEYALRLSEDEILSLQRHLWELRGVHFDYYFLKYNCSYQLMSLLEAARPQLRLVDRFRGWAIPADTLRALRDVPGLVGEIGYRPALSTVLASQAASLSQPALEQALNLAHGQLATDAPALQQSDTREQARELQVAHDYLYYEYLGQRMPRETALPRARELLLARSKLGGTAAFPTVPRPDTAPDEGHKTRRASMGVIAEGGRAGLHLRLRPAYHDLLDTPAGYGTGAQIKFLDVGLSLDIERGDARLEDLRVIDIVSLALRDEVFKPVSWRFGTGLRRPQAPLFDPEAAGLGLYFEGGPGLAWGSTRRLGYVHALASLDINPDLQENHSAGLGTAVGMLLRPQPKWGLLLELGTIEHLWGEALRDRWVSFGQQWQLNPELGLRLELEHRSSERQSGGRVSLSGQWYF